MALANTGTESGRNGREASREAVAFLARSEHRVRVLELLGAGERTRDELKAETSATRVTLSRVLGDLEDRGWVTRGATRDRYVLTPFGETIYRDFGQLLDTVTVGRRLPGMIDRLPEEWFGFDLRHLVDADRIASESADPHGASRAVANAITDADDVRALVGCFTTLPLYAYAEALRTGAAPNAEVVYDEETTELSLKNDAITDQWRRIEEEQSIYYSVDRQYPCTVDLLDDEVVYVSLGRDRGSGFDVLRSTNPVVVDWARERFERERADAVPLSERMDEPTP